MTTQSKIAIRNRAIKRALEQAFGRGKVTVRGGRGTGYGWVSVDIDYAPADRSSYSDLRVLATKLAAQAALASGYGLGRGYTDDTCQTQCYELLVSFQPCRAQVWQVRRG